MGMQLRKRQNEPAAAPAGSKPSAERSLPLHREVANQLISRITDGTYPVGSLLPTETELTATFQVSRHTIREAVRYLQSMGLVVRRQGRGTTVRSAQVQREFKLAIRTFSDIENHGYFTHLMVVRDQMIAADSMLAQELPCAVGDRFLHVASRRVPIDDSIPLPTAWNDTYIVERYAGIKAELGHHKGPVYSLLERVFGERISAIEQEVRAIEMDREIAKALGARAGAPALRIKRTYFGRSDKPVMFGYNTYTADRFSLNMRLEHD
jgi:GntR family transcriptional regulator